LCTAARASSELLRRARITRRSIERILQGQRSGGSAYPQTNANRYCAKARRRPAGATPSKELAGEDHRGRPLELLHREKPKRVAHQHRDSCAIVFLGGAHSSQHDDERGKRQVGLGLAATRRKPQKIHDLAVSVSPLSKGRDDEQLEGKLK